MRGVFILIFLLPLSVFGQDTSCYCQKSASMYSDCYTFYRENTGDRKGAFIHEIHTDDAQVWYGRGLFTEYRKRLELSYQQQFDTLKVDIKIDSSRFSDSIVFVNKNIVDLYHSLIYHYSTSVDSPLIHFNDVYLWFDSTFSVQKSRFLNNIFWFNNDTNKLFFLPKTKKQIIVSLAYNPPNRLHFLTPKKVEVLRKKKNGFVVKALWSNKRKELFVKRKN